MTLNLPAQIPTLIGSSLSCVATLAVLVIIVVHWSVRHSLRHVLIANLILSEFINTLNNTISGIYILTRGDIPARATPACIANGFIGQLSVQATDFAVLSMAISTLFIVTRPTVMADSSTRTKLLATAAVWTFPIVSSTVIISRHAFGPVSGNWCWIIPEKNNLRYGLGHGIRFAVIIATIIIYGIVFRIVREKLASSLQSSQKLYGTTTNTHVAAIHGGRTGGEGSATETVAENDIEMANLINKSTLVTISVDQKRLQDEAQMSRNALPPTQKMGRVAPSSPTQTSAKKLRVQNRQNVARIMLMRAYPFSYVLLWLPGIANRLAELAGHPMQWLVISQASTQFIGLVDSVLYVVQWRILKRD
ncbi:hypothetical protein ANO11243_062420 [Dothideomycetidae sp. 11243]|nr:hypothetical protein ANO11243_062420 [fungal sp. No.11243]